MGKLRLLVVDDKEQYVNLLTETLSAVARDTEVVASATGGEEALAAVAGTEFDVAVVDYKMPGMDGLELATRLKEAHPGCKVLILTAFTDQISLINDHPAVDASLDKLSVDTIGDALHALTGQSGDPAGAESGKRKRGMFKRG